MEVVYLQVVPQEGPMEDHLQVPHTVGHQVDNTEVLPLEHPMEHMAHLVPVDISGQVLGVHLEHLMGRLQEVPMEVMDRLKEDLMASRFQVTCHQELTLRPFSGFKLLTQIAVAT